MPSFSVDVGVAVDAVRVVRAVVEEVLTLPAPTAEIAVASAEGSHQASARAWSRRRQGEEGSRNKSHQPPWQRQGSTARRPRHFSRLLKPAKDSPKS